MKEMTEFKEVTTDKPRKCEGNVTKYHTRKQETKKRSNVTS